jgi:Uma2 family endonuclease
MNVITPVAPAPVAPVPETAGAVVTAPDRKRFTVEEYHRLIDLGFFAEGDRIELIYGDLVEMVAKNKAHIVCCRRLLQHLPPPVGNQGIVQCQDPVIMPSASEPEPDFAVLQPLIGDDKPNASDVLLVIEVSDSSLDYDRAVKGPLYASGQIPHYWIFNVLDKQVECLSQPQQNAQGGWAYGLQQIILPNQMLALPQPLSGSIDLTKIFA